MADLNNNGVLDEVEIAAYKERASKAKFKQQISYGVGAAMVFGLFSGVSGLLLGTEALKTITWATLGTQAVILPLLGVAALGVLGVGLLYMSAKFLSENTLLDQAIQAKQIGRATVAQAQAQQPAPTVEEPTKPQNFPASSVASLDAAEQGEAAQSNSKWADKFADRKDAAPVLAAKDEDARSWADKLQAAAANDAGREAAPAAARA